MPTHLQGAQEPSVEATSKPTSAPPGVPFIDAGPNHLSLAFMGDRGGSASCLRRAAGPGLELLRGAPGGVDDGSTMPSRRSMRSRRLFTWSRRIETSVTSFLRRATRASRLPTRVVSGCRTHLGADSRSIVWTTHSSA